MIVLSDDKNRENEGDLVCAAEHATPAFINFMVREARGLVCLAVEEQRAIDLDLPLMVPSETNETPWHTAFTVSVDAREGTTTGISAADRARTIQVVIDPKTRPSDLLRPGHLFPLRARPGGVLERPGHTEGAIELMRLAGLTPAAVICEIMNDDGTMARLPDLKRFAARQHLLIVSIRDLIAHCSKR